MEEIRYEDLEEFVPERWTVREFIDWLEMWLTDEEMDLPFFINYEPAIVIMYLYQMNFLWVILLIQIVNILRRCVCRNVKSHCSWWKKF